MPFLCIVVDKAPEESLWAKVKEETQLDVSRFEIVQQLFPVGIHKRLRSLRLHDQPPIDQHVCSKLPYDYPIVPNIDAMLARDP